MEAVLDPLLGRTAKGRSAHPSAPSNCCPQMLADALSLWEPDPPVLSSVSCGGHLVLGIQFI